MPSLIEIRPCSGVGEEDFHKFFYEVSLCHNYFPLDGGVALHYI